eukprot:6446968-Amphidinium_carterae.1
MAALDQLIMTCLSPGKACFRECSQNEPHMASSSRAWNPNDVMLVLVSAFPSWTCRTLCPLF